MTHPVEGPPLDATAVARAVGAGETSARATTEACLARIEDGDAAVGAFAEILAENARARADALDHSLADGHDPGPLAGVPLLLKANMCLAGVEAHCGSRVLAGYRPPYTATFVRRAVEAGAIPIGTAHMDEFAMGSSGENSAHRTTRNPWDRARAPGGSSSGCAAAVAAELVPLALGSDTGGSVRQPAALCGISGFKPSYGRVSRRGLVAFGSSLDAVAPLARSVRDLELVMGVLAGRDPQDATTLDEDTPAFGSAGAGDLTGVRVGVPREFFPDELDPAVDAQVRAAIDALERLGAELREISLPSLPHALPTYYVVATAEASSNLARFDGVRFGPRVEGDGSLAGMMAATRTAGFGDEVKRRILLGTYVLSSGYRDAWYGRAQRVRAFIAREFRAAFDDLDLLVGPTSPTPAFLLGERNRDPLAMYLADVLTVPASLAGLPAASVPCGFVEADGGALPVGLQLIGPGGDDAGVLAAARCYQEATDHHRRRPPVAGESA